MENFVFPGVKMVTVKWAGMMLFLIWVPVNTLIQHYQELYYESNQIVC